MSLDNLPPNGDQQELSPESIPAEAFVEQNDVTRNDSAPIDMPGMTRPIAVGSVDIVENVLPNEPESEKRNLAMQIAQAIRDIIANRLKSAAAL